MDDKNERKKNCAPSKNTHHTHAPTRASVCPRLVGVCKTYQNVGGKHTAAAAAAQTGVTQKSSLSHHTTTPLSLSSHAALNVISSDTVIPRSLATSSGVRWDLSPTTVARALLSGLPDPSCLPNAFLTPASSSTTRTAPTRNDAGTFGGGAEHDFGGAKHAVSTVRKRRAARERDRHHLLFGVDHRLLDGVHHLLGGGGADADL